MGRPVPPVYNCCYQQLMDSHESGNAPISSRPLSSDRCCQRVILRHYYHPERRVLLQISYTCQYEVALFSLYRERPDILRRCYGFHLTNQTSGTTDMTVSVGPVPTTPRCCAGGRIPVQHLPILLSFTLPCGNSHQL
jgi:hypothetical protein